MFSDNTFAKRMKAGATLTTMLFAIWAFPASAATITVTQPPSPASIDLTATGTTDWVSWVCTTNTFAPQPCNNGNAASGTNPYARKNVVPVIADLILDSSTDSGGNAFPRYLAGPAPTMTWSDGDPAAIWSEDGLAHPTGTTTRGILQWCPDPGCGGPGGPLGAKGTSFTFPVTATTTGPSELNLHVGGFRGAGRLTVGLAGAPAVVVDYDFGTGGSNVSFQINFEADQVGDILSAKWEQTESYGNSSNLWLQAATLDAPDPDTDGDGVADSGDLCPGTAAAAAVDSNGCSDAQADGDDDGVCDSGAASTGPSMCTGNDVCAGTVIPESVPSAGLKSNRWALVNNDRDFDTVSKGKGKGPNRSYSTTDTAGCSCEQIITEQGLGNGHTKHGCSIGAMDDWVDLVNP